MFADDVRDVDNRALLTAASNADVLTIGFPAITERLLIDMRWDARHGPLVAVVSPASSVHKRFYWLGVHRGGLGAPERFAFGVWPHSIRALRESSFLQAIRDRLASAPGDSSAQIAEALAELDRLDGARLQQAIAGAPPWATLWSRPGSADQDSDPLAGESSRTSST